VRKKTSLGRGDSLARTRPSGTQSIRSPLVLGRIERSVTTKPTFFMRRNGVQGPGRRGSGRSLSGIHKRTALSGSPQLEPRQDPNRHGRQRGAASRIPTSRVDDAADAANHDPLNPEFGVETRWESIRRVRKQPAGDVGSVVDGQPNISEPLPDLNGVTTISVPLGPSPPPRPYSLVSDGVRQFLPTSVVRKGSRGSAIRPKRRQTPNASQPAPLKSIRPANDDLVAQLLTEIDELESGEVDI